MNKINKTKGSWHGEYTVAAAACNFTELVTAFLAVKN
jgi:hypothetical protein